MIRLFTGWDPREALGWHAFAQSVIERSSLPVALIPLAGPQRDGSNAFTYARFLVPSLCGYEGMAIFADGSDMVAAADVSELAAAFDPRYAVQVVKHDYRTRHPRKYVGTEMECENRDYARKNWSSLIVWNCGHPQNAILRPENVQEWSGEQLHTFGWLPDDLIGALPREWNWLSQEHGRNDAAKVVHYTAGIPQIPAYKHGAHSAQWFAAATSVYSAPESVRAKRHATH